MDYIEKWKAERERKAFLALDDGAVFHGVAFGAKKEALGEVVFNTGMSGYQEILTDPSYAGQFVTLTTAEVGNYGINGADTESRALFLSGLVIGDLTAPSNWRSEKSLDEYLAENGVPGIYGVDTRALTLHIREHGNRKAYLCMGGDEEEAIAKAREWVGLDGQDYAAKVTCGEKYVFSPTESSKIGGLEDCGIGGLERCGIGGLVDCGLGGVEKCGSNREKSLNPPTQNPPILQSQIPQSSNIPLRPLPGKTYPHSVCYDFGVKTNILRSLASWAKVTVVPAKTSAEDVLAMKPDGVFLSNGPADPAAVTYAIENIRKLLGKVPMMGICLGHQLLSLACGAKTGRLKFGHHGCNHPVKNLATGKVEITSQNHNFAVLPESVPDCLEVTHINLNDNSIEGVRHKTLPAFSVQYHPESCPGPHDSHYLFKEFKEMVLTVQNV